MRKVFSSQRLENVEAVAELLRNEGIAVKISNGRSYRSSRRATFSYDSRRMPEELPSVWIVYSEDQPRGRQLLREMGLLESTRDPGSSYLPSGRHGDAASGKAGFFSAKRIRLGLLVLTVAGIGLVAFGMRKQDAADIAMQPEASAPERAPPPLTPEAITDVQIHRVDVPTALAVKLFGDALAARKPAAACASVDGGDPSPAVLQAFAAGKTRLHPASTCPGNAALALAVSDYMTDGCGSGEVQATVGTKTRTLRVERDGAAWNVLGNR